MESYCWSRTAGEREESSALLVFYLEFLESLCCFSVLTVLCMWVPSVWQEVGITVQCDRRCQRVPGKSVPLLAHSPSQKWCSSGLISSSALVLWVRHTCIMSAVAPAAGVWGFKYFVKYRRELRSCSCVSFSRLPRKQGSILYCTTGIVLQWLQSDK